MIQLSPLWLRFPFYFELKIAFVIWLLSPYTKGSSVLYRKFVHPTLSNKERVRAPLKTICVPSFMLNCLPSSDRCLCSAAGDRWVHCSGQRQELWDHDEVWKEESQPGCQCCRHCSHQGEQLSATWHILHVTTWRNVQDWRTRMKMCSGYECLGDNIRVFIFTNVFSMFYLASAFRPWGIGSKLKSGPVTLKHCMLATLLAGSPEITFFFLLACDSAHFTAD